MSGIRKKTVNGSIRELDKLVHQAGIRLKTESGNNPPRRPAEPIVPPREIPEACSDEELFSDAMNDVQRASWRHDPHPTRKPPRIPSTDTEAEDLRLMQEAVNPDSPITIPDHPEYIEGWIGVEGKRFLPNLRNGLYSIQGQLDLHGLNQAEAQAAVEEYIARMSRFRSCCVKIIHGRGINSPVDRATLKEGLQRLLSTRRMARYVVAYASAPPRDGGVGAVYVLLSRQ